MASSKPLTPQQILDQPWPPKAIDDATSDFVFLSVDVIRHSRLFLDHMNNAALRASHELLSGFRELVKDAIPDYQEYMEWDWAGDGGIFAFQTTHLTLKTAEKAILVAEEIRRRLKARNASEKDPMRRLEVRLVLTQGRAYHYSDRELRCGSALNLVKKIHVPGERTSITITESVFLDLQETTQAEFRLIDPMDTVNTPCYAYVPALKDALYDELEHTDDPMQAAHLAYRIGVLNFGTNDRSSAIAAFRRAGVVMERVKESHRYYHRVFRAFYALWLQLAECTPPAVIAAGDRNDRRKMLRHLTDNDQVKAALGDRLTFLQEMEFCLEQLDILARRPVADPTGLTSMQICLLLERCGYPRRWHGAAISERIQRLISELTAKERDPEWQHDTWTVDKGCSLCTAVAASCLILEDHHDVYVRRMIDWLASKRQQRFAYRTKHVRSRVGEDKHSLHYAASVLQALVDYDKEHRAIEEVTNVFFDVKKPPDPRFEPSLFPGEWTRYLHIPYFDLACYIFSALARTCIAKPEIFSNDQCEFLRRSLAVFANRLNAEAREADLAAQPGRLYAARENLGSFALGLLVGFPANAILLFQDVRELISMVACEDELDTVTERKTTVDSNFDRMWRMLDGWLLQWECALTARERSLDIRKDVAELFPQL